MHSGAAMEWTNRLPERLGEVPVFEILSGAQRRLLASSIVERAIEPREVLYEQGEPARSCFVVLSGAVRLSVSLGRRSVVSGLATVNQIFGFEALRDNAERRDTATASDAARLLELDSRRLRRFLFEHPAFQYRLLDYALNRQQAELRHAMHISHYDAEQRLAAYLIDHCSPGQPLGGRQHNTFMSQAELADYLALTPETLCRKLGKFRRLGWISGRGNEYLIKKRAPLAALLER